MCYVASVITFSIFLELLQKSTLLVRYKLIKSGQHRLNQFDIRALLFGVYARFLLLYKMFQCGQWKPAFRQLINVTVSWLALTLFLLSNGILLQYFQLSSQNSYNIALMLRVFLLSPQWMTQNHLTESSLLKKTFERVFM